VLTRHGRIPVAPTSSAPPLCRRPAGRVAAETGDVGLLLSTAGVWRPAPAGELAVGPGTGIAGSGSRNPA
jgi:hypothetical protein